MFFLIIGLEYHFKQSVFGKNLKKRHEEENGNTFIYKFKEINFLTKTTNENYLFISKQIYNKRILTVYCMDKQFFDKLTTIYILEVSDNLHFFA